MGVPSQGALAKAAYDSVTPIDTGSTGFEFLVFGVKETKEHLQTNGIRGTRSRSKERNVEGLKRVGGPLVINPSPLDLDFFLPRILGSLESADSFTVAETLQPMVLGGSLFADDF